MSAACVSCGYGPPMDTRFCPNCGARMAVAMGHPQQQIPMQIPVQVHVASMPVQQPGVYPQQQQQPWSAAAYPGGMPPQSALAPPVYHPQNSMPQMNIPQNAMPPPQAPMSYQQGAMPPQPMQSYVPSPPAQMNTPPASNSPSKRSNSPSKPKIDVPPAATGEEAATIYKRMLAAVRGANTNNDEVVSAFKRDCKGYGQGEIKAKVFLQRLPSYFGGAMMVEHMLPQLARLIPDDRMRKKLIKAHAKSKDQQPSGGMTFERHSSMSSMSAGSSFSDSDRQRPSSASDMRSSEAGTGKSASERLSSMTSKLRVQGYKDNPKCSICVAEFDHLKKRRHRCRKCGASVCSLCSPAKMLIPPEQVVSGTKDYDPSHPQRVCTICAPLLHNFQEGMISQYANANKENPHESKTRLHLPYSKSLERECRNAADIIGNFFRPEYGANSDRSIPVAFLKRAHGLAFLTVIKAGLLISAKAGSGIVIAKLPDGSWSAPSAIGTAGISGGFEAGGEIVEFMIILGSTGAVKVFHRTQVSIGGGLSVAVGPYGRDASAQAAASRGGVNANYSYSHSRGLFVGVSLEGAVITSRAEVNSNFYGKQLTPEEILNGSVPQPRAAQCLYDAINDAMAGVARHEAAAAQAQGRGCIHCQCHQFVSKNPFSKKCKICNHQHDK